MAKNEAAWRHPVHGAMVILPDGHVMTGNKARDQGWKIEDFPANVAKTATPHPHDNDKVIIARGAYAERAKAIAAGFTVNENVAAPIGNENAAIAQAHKSWRNSILALPEARDRESAVVELVTSQTSNTMSVESARAFLRGLPIEQTEAPNTMTTKTDPRAARLAEIATGANAFNVSRGFAPKAKAAASPSSFDPVKLQRLADIRLAAITMRMEKGEMALANEQKKLSYAMSVHAQTGLPLATVFAQLDVDTSKMLA